MKRSLENLRFVLAAVAILIVMAVAMFWAVTRDPHDAPVPTDNAQNPLITPLGVSMIAAHRAGASLAPENTMAALEQCVRADYRIDIFEFDLHLTSDGQLVLLHDATLDRTSDAAEVFAGTDIDVGTKTLAELKRLNMGAMFVTEDGTMPYAALHGDSVPDDLRITTLDEALTFLEGAGDYHYIIEIKNEGERGFEAADKLYATLREHGCLGKAVIGTFHNEVTEYMDEHCPGMMRSAGVKEVLDFYISASLNQARSAESFRFEALQIPTTDYIVNLGTSRVVNYAHAHNIAVQYWTINDPAEMARLSSIGADAIITDVPDVAAGVLRQPE